MRLTVIGCSGSFPGPGSAASCYLVEADDETRRPWRVLLDLGNGALGPLQQVVGPRAVDAVLLSHLHPDHFLDLCGLYVALRYDPVGMPATRVPVYGPSDTTARLEAAYGADAHGRFDQVFDVRAWDGGTPVEVGPVRVTPRRVNHPVEAYGLRVEHGGRALAYSGDTDACPALVDLARDVDLFLAEASFQEGRDVERDVHLTGRRAGQAAAQARARSLVLTHLPPWTDADVVAAEARSAFDGPVQLAAAGRAYEV